MVWPNVVALPWLASVASERAAASAQGLQAHLWEALRAYGWWLGGGWAELQSLAPALSRTPLSLLHM